MQSRLKAKKPTPAPPHGIRTPLGAPRCAMSSQTKLEAKQRQRLITAKMPSMNVASVTGSPPDNAGDTAPATYHGSRLLQVATPHRDATHPCRRAYCQQAGPSPHPCRSDQRATAGALRLPAWSELAACCSRRTRSKYSRPAVDRGTAFPSRSASSSCWIWSA